MKNIILVLIFSIILSGCVTVSSKSIHINPGQSKDNVLSIMGNPESRQFHKKQEAWQYCSTGFVSDDYIIVWFENNIVTGLNSYKKYYNGACSSFFKSVNWEKAPDTTIEFRSR